MRLYSNCIKCTKEISFFTWEPDRIHLAMDKGQKIELKCKNCGHVYKYHLNDLTAKESKVALIIGLAIFLVGTPLTVYFLWDYLFKTALIHSTIVFLALISVPITIYSLIEKEQLRKVSHFNSFKINE